MLARLKPNRLHSPDPARRASGKPAVLSEQVAEIESANFFDRLAEMLLQEMEHLPAKSGIFKQQSAYVLVVVKVD
jgi:hypothetical protein